MYINTIKAYKIYIIELLNILSKKLHYIKKKYNYYSYIGYIMIYLYMMI